MDVSSVLTRKLFPSRFYDPFFIGEYGRIEAVRANRYNTCFSVIVIEAAGLEAEAPEDQAGAERLTLLAKTLLESVRSCDITGISEDRKILVILPETDHFGSLMAVRKLTKALSGLRGAGVAAIAHATFPKDGRTFGDLLGSAFRRIKEKKESAWESLGLKDKLFWEIIGDLTNRKFKGFESATFDAGAGQDLSEFYTDQINELIIKEICRAPQRRGIMYYAARAISAGLPLLKSLGSAGPSATKIFLVGEGDGNSWELRNATPLVLDDPRFRENFFTFFLSEDAAYALVCKENWGDTFSCFHTADNSLVEGLIGKFQNEYSLQEQLG